MDSNKTNIKDIKQWFQTTTCKTKINTTTTWVANSNNQIFLTNNTETKIKWTWAIKTKTWEMEIRCKTIKCKTIRCITNNSNNTIQINRMISYLILISSNLTIKINRCQCSNNNSNSFNSNSHLCKIKWCKITKISINNNNQWCNNKFLKCNNRNSNNLL